MGPLDPSQLETTFLGVHIVAHLHLGTQKGPDPMGDLPVSGSKAKFYHQ